MATDDAQESAHLDLRLEGEVTIYQAEQLKQDLLASLEKTQVLEINLAGVTDLDTAGVQLLMLLKETARARNKELRLTAHSEAVVDVFELINLIPYFGDPLLIAPAAASTASRASTNSAEHADES